MTGDEAILRRIRVRSVAIAQAARLVHPSTMGWYGSPKIA